MWGKALAMLLVVLAASAAAQPDPAFVQVVGGISRTIEAPAGTTVEQEVRVQNTGAEAVYVSLFFQDVTFDDLGLAQTPVDSHDRSAVAWITGPADPVLVPGGQTVRIPYQVSVPQEAAGAYWAEIIVRPETSDVQTWNINDRTTIPLQVVTQYAGVLFASVSGTGSNDIEFVSAAIEPASQAAEGASGLVLRLSMRNHGDRADVFRIRAQFMNDQGELVRVSEGRARLIGGLDRTVEIPLEDIPAGEYTLIVIADAGQQELFAREYRVAVR